MGEWIRMACALSMGAVVSACAGESSDDGEPDGGANDVGIDVIADGSDFDDTDGGATCEGSIAVEGSGESVDFGTVPIGAQATRTLVVRNTGCGPLLVAQAQLFGESGEFELALDDFAGVTLGPAGTVDDETTEAIESDAMTLDLGFAPTEIGPASGRLLLYSNDRVTPELRIELEGSGEANEPPVAIASCTVRDSGLPAVPGVLDARPLDSIDCTGATSYDPDGEIVTWHWTLVARPEGSSAAPSPADAAMTSLFVDVAALADEEYELQLTVTDDSGVSSTEPASVTIRSVPDADIFVQLVWNTPGDADQTDTGAGRGSDLDLHLLHSNGCWDSVWDCEPTNGSPDWGGPGTSDDPSIDIDDTDGAGPENANLSNPESGVTYTVGVHYWDPWGYGPSDATVRIYIHGELVYEETRTLEADNQFWEVAEINWPSASLVEIGRMYDDLPACEGDGSGE